MAALAPTATTTAATPTTLPTTPPATVAPRRRSAVLALALVIAAACAGPAGEGAANPSPVSFATDDGGVVWADEYGSGERGVVLVHGGRLTKDSWGRQAARIAAAGHRVLAIDLRGRGRSVGGPDADGDERADLDVLAAVRLLQSAGAESIVIVGASLGGWAASRAAAGAGPGVVDGLVVLASTVHAPERLPGAKLFVVARDDVRGDGVRRLDEMRMDFVRTPPPKRFVELDGAAHAQALFESDAGERVLDEILSFLDEVNER